MQQKKKLLSLASPRQIVYGIIMKQFEEKQKKKKIVIVRELIAIELKR